jgi:hypothetical protein
MEKKLSAETVQDFLRLTGLHSKRGHKNILQTIFYILHKGLNLSSISFHSLEC